MWFLYRFIIHVYFKIKNAQSYLYYNLQNTLRMHTKAVINYHRNAVISAVVYMPYFAVFKYLRKSFTLYGFKILWIISKQYRINQAISGFFFANLRVVFCIATKKYVKSQRSCSIDKWTDPDAFQPMDIPYTVS